MADLFESELNGPEAEPARAVGDGFDVEAAVIIRRSQVLVSEWFDSTVGERGARGELARRLQLEIAAGLRRVYAMGQRGISLAVTVEES